MLQKQASTSK